MIIDKYIVRGSERYRIVSAKNPNIVIDDAQGYGFKTYAKALAFITRQKVNLVPTALAETILPLF